MNKKVRLCQDEFENYQINGQEIIITAAEKAYLFDQHGRRYIDFHNGYGTTILGYSNAVLKANIQTLLQDNLYYVKCPTEYLFNLKELLLQDYPDCDAVAFYTTGTTAVKAAISAVIKENPSKKIVLSAGYHGWDPMWEKSEELFQPNNYGVIDFYFILEKFEELLSKYHDEICAVVISPDRIHFSENFFDRFFELAKKYNILIIDDGVKSAYRYKLGSLIEKWNYPNMIHTASKCISNGARISAVLYNSKYDPYFKEYVYTTFFDTSAALTAISTIETMHSENVPDKIRVLGERFLTAAKAYINDISLNLEIIGCGNMFQFIFPDDESEEMFYQRALIEGLYFFAGDNQSISYGYDNDIIDEAIESFKKVALYLKDNKFCLKPITNERVFLAALEQSEGCPEKLSLEEKCKYLQEYVEGEEA